MFLIGNFGFLFEVLSVSGVLAEFWIPIPLILCSVKIDGKMTFVGYKYSQQKRLKGNGIWMEELGLNCLTSFGIPIVLWNFIKRDELE